MCRSFLFSAAVTVPFVFTSTSVCGLLRPDEKWVAGAWMFIIEQFANWNGSKMPRTSEIGKYYAK